jgi:phosphate transport system ATP-binding protein
MLIDNYTETMPDKKLNKKKKKKQLQVEKKQKIKSELKIIARNLNVFYGDFQALKNVNLDVKPFTVTALIGPSGCGKSTFLRVFNRMNDYIADFRLEGEVLIDDIDIYKEQIVIEKLRKEVGMVFQKPNPFPKSIFENVAFGLKIQGESDKYFILDKVEAALKQVNLWDEVKDNLRKNALSLSGGQQQRLCLARTLAVEPDIVLMDEPTSALDPISTGKIEELIFELKNEYTILIVTHNMQQAGRVSDRTAFFYLGELIEEGATRDIFLNPKVERTENYITGRFG